MTIAFPRVWLAIFLWLAFSCKTQHSPNKEMTHLLQTVAESENVPANAFASARKKVFYDSLLQAAATYPDSASASFGLANTLLELGQEDKAIPIFESLLQGLPPYLIDNKMRVMKSLAIAYL